MVQTISQTRSNVYNTQPANQRANKLTGSRFHSAPQNKRVVKNLAILNAPPTTTSNASNTNSSNTPLIAQPQTTDSITSDSLAVNSNEEKSIWKWVLGALAIIGGLALGAFLLRNKGGDKPSKSSQTNEAPEAADSTGEPSSIKPPDETTEEPEPQKHTGTKEDILAFWNDVTQLIDNEENYLQKYLTGLMTDIKITDITNQKRNLTPSNLIEILQAEITSSQEEKNRIFTKHNLNEQIINEQIVPIIGEILKTETQRIQNIPRLRDTERKEILFLDTDEDKNTQLEEILGHIKLSESLSLDGKTVLQILQNEMCFSRLDFTLDDSQNPSSISVSDYLKRQELLDKYGITLEMVKNQLIPHAKRQFWGAEEIAKYLVSTKTFALFYTRP